MMDVAALKMAIAIAYQAMWRDARMHERFYKQDFHKLRRRGWKHRRSAGNRR